MKNDVLEDGETINVRTMVMDAKGNPVTQDAPLLHKPGYANPVTKDAGHYNAYNNRVSSAWKNPPALAPAVQANTARGEAPAAKAGDAYSNYDRRVSEAWRGNAETQIKKEQAAHARGERAANV